MIQFWKTLKIIFVKELCDALRDRRSLRLAFLTPVYFVAMFVASVFFIIHIQNQATGRGGDPVQLSVLGVEHLTPLITWLKEEGIKVTPVGDNAYQQVVQKKLDFALIIPRQAEQQFATGEPVDIWLAYDASNNKILTSIGFIKQKIWSWNSRMGSLRLLERGVAPGVASPIALRDMNVASDQKMGFFVMASLPMFLILSVFIASVGFTADMTAGERERRSLESLLITPASSAAIIVGKWLVSLMLTFAVLILMLALLAIAFTFIPFNQLGLRVDVSVADLLWIFVTLTSLAVIAVSLQQLIALFARSFKDAQTYMGLVIFVPMIPMVYTMINPGASEPWFAWVPVLGHQALVKDLLLGGSVNLVSLLKFWLVAIPLAIALLGFTAGQLRKPRIVYH
ncbi:MAG TPA: ABC transporter permease [Cellvibrio sp.]|nr:ABC transporter permease [Cellvibrio sp.]